MTTRTVVFSVAASLLFTTRFLADEPAEASASTTNEPTVVTSDRLEVDYAHNIGTFTGNVIAIDPRITVRADKMVVFYGNVTTNSSVTSGSDTNVTKSIQKIVADGGVVITTPENKKSNSDHAEYTADNGRVVLTGHPRVESPDGIVTGKRITFWRGQDKMDVESDVTETNRTRLLIYPEEQRKKSDEDTKSNESKP
ncbi:MAG TPA: LptA/OstA family protein [Verrucomicrobiae bacterium]|nr:LptA/OstA family protein [Verrucomicrobiae bacterium]